MEPGGTPSDTPTRLIGRDLGGSADALEDELVVGLQSCRGPLVDLGTGSAGQSETEEGLEDRGDLAVGQADLGMKKRGGLGVGTDLAGGGSQGIGGL